MACNIQISIVALSLDQFGFGFLNQGLELLGQMGDLRRVLAIERAVAHLVVIDQQSELLQVLGGKSSLSDVDLILDLANCCLRLIICRFEMLGGNWFLRDDLSGLQHLLDEDRGPQVSRAGLAFILPLSLRLRLLAVALSSRPHFLEPLDLLVRLRLANSLSMLDPWDPPLVVVNRLPGVVVRGRMRRVIRVEVAVGHLVPVRRIVIVVEVIILLVLLVFADPDSRSLALLLA